jgi:hypothetical protein
MAVGWLVLLVSAGCGARRITFVQDDYINTAVHCERKPEDRTGEPLELTIVCVYPSDLEVEANHGLRREAKITSREWYERRPIPGDKPDAEESHPRFRLPAKRIHLLTNEESEAKYYGTRIGPALNGAKIDGKAKVVKANIEFDSWLLHDTRSVIYVFGRFKDRRGHVLRAEPALFDPPGAYTRDIQLRIGVREGQECTGPTLGQYIENITERKLHKDMHGTAEHE